MPASFLRHRYAFDSRNETCKTKHANPRPTQELHETKKKSAALKLGFLVFICFPALLFLIGVILGGVICGFEDEWDYYDGFGYTLSILSGYVNVSSKHPRTAGGKIIGLLVGSWGLGGYAVAVSVIGCPFVAPLLNSFVKKNKKAFA
ncbi:hypothetical protein DIPPA_22821 [Diplonema papillatum]|nr:hypothetical protein DIPPA_22821 [Diplonema papillatum]